MLRFGRRFLLAQFFEVSAQIFHFYLLLDFLNLAAESPTHTILFPSKFRGRRSCVSVMDKQRCRLPCCMVSHGIELNELSTNYFGRKNCQRIKQQSTGAPSMCACAEGVFWALHLLELWKNNAV